MSYSVMLSSSLKYLPFQGRCNTWLYLSYLDRNKVTVICESTCIFSAIEYRKNNRFAVNLIHRLCCLGPVTRTPSECNVNTCVLYFPYNGGSGGMQIHIIAMYKWRSRMLLSGCAVKVGLLRIRNKDKQRKVSCKLTLLMHDLQTIRRSPIRRCLFL